MNSFRPYARRFNLADTLLALLALLLLTATPVMAAHAHAQSAASAEFEQYRLPDGALPDFCLNNDVGSDHQSTGPHCPLCTLAKSFGTLPRGMTTLAVPIESTLFIVPLIDQFADPQAPYPHLGPRAPPNLV